MLITCWAMLYSGRLARKGDIFNQLAEALQTRIRLPGRQTLVLSSGSTGRPATSRRPAGGHALTQAFDGLVTTMPRVGRLMMRSKRTIVTTFWQTRRI